MISKSRDEWMNVYITMKMEKYKNYVHEDKKTISGNIISYSRYKCAKILIHGKEFGFD